MKKTFLICCSVFSMTCLADTSLNTVVQQLQGVWEGAGKQDDSSTWNIKVTITPKQFLIDYPSLKCGGMLTLIKENSDSLVFQEDLTYGLNGCLNHGKTVLIKTAENNKVRYYWYHENNGKKAAAGELVRQTLPKQVAKKSL